MSSKDVLKLIKDKQVEFVDLRFTDPKGKLQHLTMDSTVVDEDMLENGVFFDGSSIAGWKAINESDMILKPDLARPIIDPFNSHTTVNIFCDILDAVKKDPYGRDPRGTAKKAEEYLKKIDEMPKFDGQISAKYVETKPNEFFMIGEWNSEDDIAKARPKMIEFLDTLRHTLEELSPDLGVTDPHSGAVIIEK